MSSSSDQHQVDIFAKDQQQLHFAELCNALYERELLSLAQHGPKNVSLLQRRLAGLSHHIKRAAENLLANQAPIDIDVHNGSWQGKQAAKCVANKVSSNKTLLWFNQHVSLGIAVPVYLNDLGTEMIELDSIDRIDHEQSKVHINKHGWFGLDGQHLEQQKQHYSQKRLLLPNKATMTAACCGHSWNHKGRSQTRTLSLRELLLSTSINWKTFT